MTAGDMRKKVALMPEDTVLYIHYNGEFLPIDCIRFCRDDEEAYVIPIKDAPANSEKDAPDKAQK